MLLVESLAWLATTLAVIGVAPQVRRLVRTGNAAGVSLVGPMFGVVGESGWTAYTMQADLWSAAPEAILMFVANLVLVRTIIRCGTNPLWGLVASCAWTGALGAIAMLGGWQALGGALSVAYAGQAAPSIWSAYRARVPTGIAPGYWLANLTEAGLWGVYGIVHGDFAVVLFAIVAGSAAGAILIRWSATRSGSGIARSTRSRRRSRPSVIC